MRERAADEADRPGADDQHFGFEIVTRYVSRVGRNHVRPWLCPRAPPRVIFKLVAAIRATPELGGGMGEIEAGNGGGRQHRLAFGQRDAPHFLRLSRSNRIGLSE